MVFQKREINTSNPHDRALLVALSEGSGISVSALEYTLHALCVFADEALENDAKLYIKNSHVLTSEEIEAIVGIGKRHVSLV